MEITSKNYNVISFEEIEKLQLNIVDFEIIQKTRMVTGADGKRHKENVSYLNTPVAFDIETTSYKDDEGDKIAFMYIWMFSIGDNVIYGRTWDEFIKLIKIIDIQLGLTENNIKMTIYVHNLEFEFAFMRNYFEWDKMLFVKNRSVISAETGQLIFRCSYILSGRSLKNVAKNIQNCKVKKMSGDLDYSLIRTSKTPLTEKELEYCFMDVIVLQKYIIDEINESGNITKIPYTNTGKVRKFVRERCLNKKVEEDFKYKTKKGKWYSKKEGDVVRNKDYFNLMKELTISLEEYKNYAKPAFMGGFTHANEIHKFKTLYNVGSYDFTSSYPAVICSYNGFPMSHGTYTDFSKVKDIEKTFKYYACVFKITIYGLRVKENRYEKPLSASKCETSKGVIKDNGRVVMAEYVSTTITELDYAVFKAFYDWDKVEFGTGYKYEKGFLPKEIIECCLELYEKKTTLKDVEGMASEYLRSKGMLNSVYGMMVMDIIKTAYTFKDGKYTNDIDELEEKVINGELSPLEYEEEVFKKEYNTIVDYNTSKTRFTFYLWGVYITAKARYNLFTGILHFGEDFVYADTDSIKFLVRPETLSKHLKYIEDYNISVSKQIDFMCHKYNIPNNSCPKTIEGIEKPLGVWDYESKSEVDYENLIKNGVGIYKRFKTLGAKRYLIETNDNKIQLTCAGIPKSLGVAYLEKEAKERNKDVFDCFELGMEITVDKAIELKYEREQEDDNFTVKNTHFYIDDKKTKYVKDYLGVTDKITSLSGVYLEIAPFKIKNEDTDWAEEVLSFVIQEKAYL